MEKAFTYILCCSDNSFYCGWTNSPVERLAAHNGGKGAKYTRGRLPVKMVYLQMLPTKSEALQREIQIKKLTKPQKLALIKDTQLNLLISQPSFLEQ